MATPLLAAIRTRRDLKESLQHTAQELAHLASIYGVAKVSYTYLAQKCRCSKRTAMRHIQRLLDLHIIDRARMRRLGAKVFEMNTYTFRIAWDRSPSTGGSDTMARKLPQQEGEKKAPRREAEGNPKEKNLSLAEELANQRKAVREGWVSPGSERWAAVTERIVYLERLLAPEPAAVA